MGRIGFGLADNRPAMKTPRPVALANKRIVQKILLLNRLRMLPLAFGVTIGRNTRRRRATRTGNDEQSPAIRERSAKRFDRRRKFGRRSLHATRQLRRSTARSAARAMRGMFELPMAVPAPWLSVKATASFLDGSQKAPEPP